MSNPSVEVYKIAKHALMHIHAHNTPVTWGGPGCSTLQPVDDKDSTQTFSLDKPSYLLHQFSDSNLDTPSVTGGVQMLAGGVIEAISQRQHLISPDAHTSEVVAAGTCFHRLEAIRGLLQELRIYQIARSPLYLDSLSTVYIAQDTAGVKRSIWALRRVAVLHQGKDEIKPFRIPEIDMVADGLTKPLRHEVWKRHLTYTNNVASNGNFGKK